MKPSLKHFGKKLKIAILGTGNIGTDLLMKSQRSPYLECTLFAGRTLSSPGMGKANSLGVPISDKGIQAIQENPGCCDLVFDATSASSHREHWPILDKLGKVVVDMTPAKLGVMCIPAINLDEALLHNNLNMITCGGQVSIPLAYVLGKLIPDIDYIEVVSSIASRSAGPATRLNIDEYILTTQKGVLDFSRAKRAKAILILNPAQPCIDMQTTVFAEIKEADMTKITQEVERMVKAIQGYVPGYQMILPPTLENGRLAIMIRVQGLGDFLPRYAGNLDIINCAAIAVAEAVAKKRGFGPENQRLLSQEAL